MRRWVVGTIAAVMMVAGAGTAAADKYECLGQTCMNITTMAVESGVISGKLRNMQTQSMSDVRIDCNNGMTTIIEGDDILNGPFFPNSLAARLCAVFGKGGDL